MRITEARLRYIIRSLIREAPYDVPLDPPEPTQPFDLDKVAEDTVEEINKDPDLGTASIGRREVKSARRQNADVFVAGPYRIDFVNQVNQAVKREKREELGKEDEPDSYKPGDYYFSIYRRTETGQETFDLYQKYGESHALADAKAIARSKGSLSSSDAKKILWRAWEAMKEDPDYPKTEAHWEAVWAAAAKSGRGTHHDGKAFDLKGFSSNTPSEDIDKIYQIGNKIAQKYSAELLPFGVGSVEEADHLHLAYDAKEDII